MLTQYLSRDDYSQLVKLAELRHFKRGDFITIDNPIKKKPIYIIKEGLVSILGLQSNISELVHMIYGPNEIFPIPRLNYFKKDNNEPIRARAETNASIYVIPAAILDQYMSVSVKRERAFTYQIVDQFKLYMLRVENLEFPLARERVAYRILFFASRFGSLQDGLLTIPRVSGKTIASALNLSEEAFSREMGRLRILGIISYQADKVVINDPDKLQIQISKNVKLPFSWPSTENKSLNLIEV
jgi:CRP-like cAMP-binding protein